MKEKIRQFANGQFHKKTPKISISAERLSIEIERGEDYHGSFLVTSTNEAEMKGFLQTTNPAVQLGSDELRGKSQQIAFSVRGAELEPYE